MRCPMCGYEFEVSGLACHASCPLAAGCKVVCCPRCGYSTVSPDSSMLARLTQRLLRRSAAPPTPAAQPGSVPLLRLEPGQEGRVADILEAGPETLHHLTQFGIMPGIAVRLCQKRPVPIVQVGQTDLALDREIAAHIYVELAPGTLSRRFADAGSECG